MSKAIITEQHLHDIADAIIAKGGATAPMTPAQMPAAIQAIPTGGDSYHYGYYVPHGFPDFDQNIFSGLGYSVYGLFVKSEIKQPFEVLTRGNAGVFIFENGKLVLEKQVPAPVTTDRAEITPELVADIESDCIVVGANILDQRNAFPVFGRCVDSVIINQTISVNSANFTNDRRGFVSNSTQRIIYDGCTVNGNVYAQFNSPNIQDVILKNCNLSGSWVLALNSPTIKNFEVRNSTISKITSCDRFLNGASSIRTLDLSSFDFSGIANQQNCLVNCYQLEDFSGINIACPWNFTTCYSLNHDSLVNILNAVETVSSATTLTLGANHLAKLTDAEKQIATDKGWTLI